MSIGFEHTEGGVVPRDWSVSSLVELVEEGRGIRYGIVQPGKYDPNGKYLVRGQDYSKGWVSPDNLFRVSPQIEEPYKNARVKAGDLIITIVGAGTGTIEEVPEWLDGANLTQTTARLAIDPSKAVRGYCKAYLQSSAGRKQVANYIKGAAQPGLNCGDIEKFKIPLPPTLTEQHAIAEALGDVDALLASLDRLIAKKRDIKQAVMQQLLTGKTRLPGFSGEWKVEPFSSIMVRLNAKTYQIQTSDYRASGRYPVVDQGKLPVVGFSDREDKVLRCPVGGVIVFGDHTCIVKYIDFDFLVGADGTQLLQAKSGHCTRFFALQLQLGGVEPTGYNRHFKFLKERKFLVPTLAEQNAISAVLSDLNDEIDKLEARRDKTHLLKQGMMQELLTGRTRLV